MYNAAALHLHRLDAEPRELRDLVSRGPWAVGVPSAARALLPGPRGSLKMHYSAGANNPRCIVDGRLTGVTDYGVFC